VAAPAQPGGIRLSDGQRLAWLRLIRSENVGPVTFRELINHFGTAEAALAMLPELAGRGGRLIRVASRAEAERELAAVAAAGGRFVGLGEPDYPPWLRHIDGAPPLLTMRGDPACLRRPACAVVGARNASAAGRKLAAMIAAGVGAGSFLIVSGLARGIDAAAHEAALGTGTVAVLAGGLDHIYPAEHAGLAERIVAEGGALVSELPMGWEPRARDFPRRNRLVSGMALGVVVVEAARRSGSLITARLAAEQGRVVLAVPGSPLDPRAEGSNRLIRDGATLVAGADDVLAALQPMLGIAPAPAPEIKESGPPEPPADIEEDERARVIEALGPTPIDIDTIIRLTGVRPAVVHLVLLELDLAGRIERHGSQLVSLI
jgi:DNA processing protein